MRTGFEITWIGGVLLAMLLCGMAVLLAEEEEKKQAKPVTIVGEVLMAEENADGNATQAGIWTDDDDYYLVARDAKGKELLKLIGKRVSMTGTITEEADDDSVITVASYRLLPEKKEADKAPAAKEDADEEIDLDE